MKAGVWMLGLCGLWAAGGAWGAECPPAGNPERLLFDIPAQTLQRDLPVGSVVWQGTRQVQQAASLAPCAGAEDARLNLLGSDSGLKSGNSAVYGTTISGLGYALDTDAAFSEGWPASGALAAGKRQISLRLVVTEPLASGVLATETLAAARSTASRCWISPCKSRLPSPAWPVSCRAAATARWRWARWRAAIFAAWAARAANSRSCWIWPAMPAPRSTFSLTALPQTATCLAC